MANLKSFKIFFSSEDNNCRSIIWHDSTVIEDELLKTCVARGWNLDHFQIRDSDGEPVDTLMTFKEYGKEAVYMKNAQEAINSKRSRLLKKTETLKTELVKSDPEPAKQELELREKEIKEKESKKKSKKEENQKGADMKEIVDFASVVHISISRMLDLQNDSAIPLTQMFTTRKVTKVLIQDMTQQQLEDLGLHEELGSALIHYFLSLEVPLLQQIYHLLLDTMEIENQEWKISIWNNILLQLPPLVHTMFRHILDTFHKLFLISKYEYPEIEYTSNLWGSILFTDCSFLKAQVFKAGKSLKPGLNPAPTPRSNALFTSTSGSSTPKQLLTSSAPVPYGTPREPPKRKTQSQSSMRSVLTNSANSTNSASNSPSQGQRRASETRARSASDSRSQESTTDCLANNEKKQSKTIRVKELKRVSAKREEKVKSQVSSGFLPSFHVLEGEETEHKEVIKKAMKQSKSTDAVSTKKNSLSEFSCSSGEGSTSGLEEKSSEIVNHLDSNQSTLLNLMFTAIPSLTSLSPRRKSEKSEISPRPGSPRKSDSSPRLSLNLSSRPSSRPSSPRKNNDSSAPSEETTSTTSTASITLTSTGSSSDILLPTAIRSNSVSKGTNKSISTTSPLKSSPSAKKQLAPLNLKKMYVEIPPPSIPFVFEGNEFTLSGQVFLSLCSDSESFIMCAEDREYGSDSSGHITLQASSFEHLIWVLFQADSFYIGIEFLKSIIEQYTSICNNELYNDGPWKLWLRQRTLQIIIRLLEIHGRSLIDDVDFSSALKNFVDDVSGGSWRPNERKLISDLDKLRNSTKAKESSEYHEVLSAFKKNGNEGLSIPVFSITGEIIAGDRQCLTNFVEQTALLHYSMFKIDWHELICQNFLDAEKAKSVWILTNHFNEIVKWVQSMILSQTELKSRVDIFSNFVDIADKCIEHTRNFFAAISILSGLESVAINRLKQTKAALSRRTMKLLDKLTQTFNYEKSYKAYRQAFQTKQQSSEEPTIPALAVFTKDLFAIEDTTKNILKKGSRDLINVHKLITLYKTMSLVSKPEKPYPYVPLENYQTYITNLSFKETEELWHLSKQVEPN